VAIRRLLQIQRTSTGGCYPSDSDAAMAEADRYTLRCTFAGVVKWQTRQP
jgi:hypothetical protein